MAEAEGVVVGSEELRRESHRLLSHCAPWRLPEEVYHRLGFREYARLPGGFKEMRDGKALTFDDVSLYLLTAFSIFSMQKITRSCVLTLREDLSHHHSDANTRCSAARSTMLPRRRCAGQ